MEDNGDLFKNISFISPSESKYLSQVLYTFLPVLYTLPLPLLWVQRQPEQKNQVLSSLQVYTQREKPIIQPVQVSDSKLIPSKSLFFAWRLIRDRLPTRMNLRRRQVMINEVQCPFCGDVEEEAAHLFFSCKKILPLWWESLSWVGVAIVLPQNPRDHYL